MKRVYKDNYASVHLSAARTKSARGTGDKPLVNRMFGPPLGLHRILFGRASGESSTTVVFDASEGKRKGCLLGEPSCRRSRPPRPACPRRPAVRRPVPDRPWYVRVLDSTGSLVARGRREQVACSARRKHMRARCLSRFGCDELIPGGSCPNTSTTPRICSRVFLTMVRFMKALRRPSLGPTTPTEGRPSLR